MCHLSLIAWALRWFCVIKVQLAVIGDWHLAYCTAVSFSKAGTSTLLKLAKAPSEIVAGIPPCPVKEPDFDDFVAEGRRRESLFSSGSWKNWSAPIWWLAIDTPVDDEDRPDTKILIETLTEGFQHQRPEVLAVSSQVPLGFCNKLHDLFKVPVVYVPENLRLGQGIETFLKADRTVIGADDREAGERVKALMKGFTTNFLHTNLASAEMVKHATNIFLATSISYANEMARVGQKFGVDLNFVTSALKADKRIGPMAYVKPGLGFAGGTLPRDLRVLQSLGQDLNIPVPLVNAVLQINESVDDVIVERICGMGLPNKKVVLAGYSYKADVDTVRRSPAERLAKRLRAQGFEVFGFDPMMNGKPLETLTDYVQHCATLEEIPPDCTLAVIVTPRKNFADLNWGKLKTFDLGTQLWERT